MKIKIWDDLEKQKAFSYMEGFMEGRNATVKDILSWKKSGKTSKEIFKTLKLAEKAFNEHNDQRD